MARRNGQQFVALATSYFRSVSLFSLASTIAALWLVNCHTGDMAQTPSANDRKKLQALLETRIAELEKATRQRDAIAVEASPDQVDEIQRASERALAICNIDRESKQLRSARAALRRIRDGSFGVCEECEEEIHPKRLLAIPWASLCIRCQEEMDSCQAAPISRDSLLGNAA
jgi:DnaK suppressor protein